MMRVGVDVGGSGTKAALVDVTTGGLVSERVRLETPANFEFDQMVDTVAEVVRQVGHEGPVGVGFPAVVVRGVVKSPPTAHEFEDWVGRDFGAALSKAIGVPVTVLNDADAAGLAERSFGAGRERDGVVMVFTLGTGVGSAMFVDGVLVPNTELGKLYLANRSEVSENQVASRVRQEEGLGWSYWGGRLSEYLDQVERLFTPDLVIVGGGVSRKHQKFLDIVDIDAEVVAAQLRNHAGIVGAAVAASSL